MGAELEMVAIYNRELAPVDGMLQPVVDIKRAVSQCFRDFLKVGATSGDILWGKRVSAIKPDLPT